MGIKDVAQYLIEEDPVVFAELFNYGYFKEEVIKPDNLKEFPSVQASLKEDKNILREGEESNKNKSGLQSVKRYRDITREVCIMQDDRNVYLCLGIENQSSFDPFMIRRVMDYDSSSYEQQERNWINNGCKGKFKYMPVHTLVINFSGEEWTGPTSLHEMMDLEGLPEYLIPNDYKITVLDPAKITPEELEKYQITVQAAWEMLKRSPDKEVMVAYIKENQNFLENSVWCYM